MFHKIVQSLMNIIRLVRVMLYFVFLIHHIMSVRVQKIWFRGNINVSNKKSFFFLFRFLGKVQTKIFPVLIYFPKVLPFLWFFLSSLLSKIRLLFEKIGRDGKLIALDHTLFHWFYYIILHSFSVCGRIFILLLFKWNACNWFENQFVLWFIFSLIC